MTTEFELKVLVLESKTEAWPHDHGKRALHLRLQTIPALSPYPASQKWELWLPAEAGYDRIFTQGSVLVLGLSDLKSATGLKLRAKGRDSSEIWGELIGVKNRLACALAEQAEVDKELGKLCPYAPPDTYKARHGALGGQAKDRFEALRARRLELKVPIDELLASQAKLEAEHVESLKPRIEEPAAA